MLKVNSSLFSETSCLNITDLPKSGFTQSRSRLIDMLDLAETPRARKNTSHNLDLSCNRDLKGILFQKIDFEPKEPKGGKFLTATNTLPTATNTLAAVCLGVHAFTVLTEGRLLMDGALCLSKVSEGQVWRVVTFPLLHVNVIHLTFNTLGLLSLGPLFEKKWGTRGLAKVAALSITANVLAQAVFEPLTVQAVGLSGVLYGIMGALNADEAREKGVFQVARRMIPALAIGAILPGIIGQQVSHVGHLSGYVAGLAFGWFSNRYNDDE